MFAGQRVGHVTIGEWIDSRGGSVPSALRSRLRAQGQVSLTALVDAAIVELEAVARGDPADRATAFSLLAADAYVTYACLWEVTEGKGDGIEDILAQVTGAPGAGPPE